MKAFVATSLKNIQEAIRITNILEEIGVEHQCCVTELGSLEGEELFNHYVKGIAESDLFISIQKNIGRDTSTEVGMAYILGKKRITVIYDQNSMTPKDSMLYHAAGERTTENELSDKVKKIFAIQSKKYLPFYKPNLKQYTSELVQKIVTTLENEIYVEGENTIAFENKLAERYGRKAIAVSSGTSGLILSLTSILENKKEVLVPAFTFPATIQAIINAGAKPVYVDIDNKTWTIDVVDAENKINEKTGAILPVNIFGNPCDVESIETMSKKYGVPVIYDSCQAIGSTTKNGEIGTFGAAEVFSLDSTKLVSGGLGGFVTTSDNELYEKIRMAKNFGLNANKVPKIIGNNSRINEFNAALALISYENIERTVNKRRRLVSKYQQHLEEVKNVKFQKVYSGSMHSYQMFGIQISKEPNSIKQVQSNLADAGFGTRVYLTDFMHKNDTFNKSSFGHLHVTEEIGKNILCLPVHEYVTDKNIEDMCKIVKETLA